MKWGKTRKKVQKSPGKVVRQAAGKPEGGLRRETVRVLENRVGESRQRFSEPTGNLA